MKIKYFTLALVFAGSITACTNDTKKDSEETVVETIEEVVEEDDLETKKVKSPREVASGQIDGVTVSVDYGSPSVKGREIWGDLVPFDNVWRAGANETTKLTLDAPLSINGQVVAAGSYGLLVLPKENEDWTVIINEAWDYDTHGVWGSNGYDENRDVLQVKVTPTFSGDMQESLKYTITENGILFQWDQASFEIPVVK
ncbi:DUF2911 domain-containing protein [Putridiphycobacter roseus]|nr:DUF2911 domain-containing protein [Putridiphycobacter roseus]